MLVDTTVFIDYLRGIKSAKDFLENQQETLATSIIVVMEIIAGLKNKSQIKSFLTLLYKLDIEIIHISSSISEIAFDIYLEMRFLGIGIADSLIAATTVNQNTKLATHNIKHFSSIPNLTTLLPY